MADHLIELQDMTGPNVTKRMHEMELDPSDVLGLRVAQKGEVLEITPITDNPSPYNEDEWDVQTYEQLGRYDTNIDGEVRHVTTYERTT